MNATTFILIVVVAYIFYFTLMVVMDAAKFSKAAVAIASGKQDFVIPQVQHNPVKVTIANTYENDLPQLDVADDDEKPEPLKATDETKDAGSNMFDALGIETITEEDPFEVDAEALNFMLS